MSVDGIGVYLRGLNKSKHGTPKQAALKAWNNRISFVAIMAMWQEQKNGKDIQLYSNGKSGELIARYAEAFAERGITVLLWGFPRGGWERPFVQRFVDVTEVCHGTVNGWLIDPEVFFKWKGAASKDLTMRKQPEYSKVAKSSGQKQTRIDQAYALVGLMLDAMNESLVVGTTSYGMAMAHPNFPWQAFGGFGFGSPQLYSVGKEDVKRGVNKWSELGWQRIIPSVPAFGKNSGENMNEHLFKFTQFGKLFVDGFIFWSWRQLDSKEWKIVRTWSDWIHNGQIDPNRVYGAV